MKDIRLLLIILLIMSISACSSVKVSQDFDLDKPIPQVNSYQWTSGEQGETGDVRVDSPLLDARIRKAVDRVLAAKGIQKIGAGTSAYKVAYQFSISKKIRSDDVRTGVGFGMGSYGRHGGVAISTGSTVTTYDEGLLVIDFTDARGELIWRGNGTRHLPQHTDPEKTEEIYNELVEKILGQFPPKTQ